MELTQKEKRQQYYIKNREKLLSYQKEYYRKNKNKKVEVVECECESNFIVALFKKIFKSFN